MGAAPRLTSLRARAWGGRVPAQGGGAAASQQRQQRASRRPTAPPGRQTAGTIFAYGQTGTGKTHTMEGGGGGGGGGEAAGVIPRAFRQIFDAIEASEGGQQFLVRASFLEVYNEEIRDLLAKVGAGRGRCAGARGGAACSAPLCDAVACGGPPGGQPWRGRSTPPGSRVAQPHASKAQALCRRGVAGASCRYAPAGPAPNVSQQTLHFPRPPRPRAPSGPCRTPRTGWTCTRRATAACTPRG